MDYIHQSYRKITKANDSIEGGSQKREGSERDANLSQLRKRARLTAAFREENARIGIVREERAIIDSARENKKINENRIERIKLEKSKGRYNHKLERGINAEEFQKLPITVQKLIGEQSRGNYIRVHTEVKGQKSADPCYENYYNRTEKRLLISNNFKNIDKAEGPLNSNPLPNFLLMHEQSREAAKSQPIKEFDTKYEEILLSQVVNLETIGIIAPYLEEDGERTLKQGDKGFDEVLKSPNCARVKRFVEYYPGSGTITEIEVFRNDPEEDILDYIKIKVTYNT